MKRENRVRWRVNMQTVFNVQPKPFIYQQICVHRSFSFWKVGQVHVCGSPKQTLNIKIFIQTPSKKKKKRITQRQTMQAYFVLFRLSILLQEKSNRSKLFEDKNGGVQGSMLMWVDQIAHCFPPNCFSQHYLFSLARKVNFVTFITQINNLHNWKVRAILVCALKLSDSDPE